MRIITFYRILLLIVLVASCQIGFSASNPRATIENLLVEPSWLKRHTSDDSLVIVDVREADAFEKGHIPQAVNIAMTKTFNPTGPKHRVGSIQHIQGLLGGAGVEKGTFVVLYDNGIMINASRVFWVLEVYGHDKVVILNGGYPAWLNKNFDVSVEVAKTKKTTYVASIRPERLATKLHTRLAIADDNKVIIDSRPEEEYSGSRAIFGRLGHIPTAKSIPWSRNFEIINNVKKIKSLDSLATMYEHLDADKKVITYCNVGEHSSFTYFILRQLGKNVAHYDGSWYEWGKDLSLPIEK